MADDKKTAYQGVPLRTKNHHQQEWYIMMGQNPPTMVPTKHRTITKQKKKVSRVFFLGQVFQIEVIRIAF